MFAVGRVRWMAVVAHAVGSVLGRIAAPQKGRTEQLAHSIDSTFRYTNVETLCKKNKKIPSVNNQEIVTQTLQATDL